MKHRFVHEFEDDPPLATFDVRLDAPQGAKIEFSLDNQDIWLSANRAGWLHLARLCAEMALHSQFEPGFHFHRKTDWSEGVGPGPEVSFELGTNESSRQPG